VEGTVFPHPPCCPDFAPSDFHIFGLLKDAVRGLCSADDTELKHSTYEKNRRFSKELCNQHTASRAKVERVKETLWKINLGFVKDVPMMYLNVIVIVIVVRIKVKFTLE
jgi:hypothetical protein